MTAAPPLSLDHVGFMVRDLDAAVARWERLVPIVASESADGYVLGVDGALGEFEPLRNVRAWLSRTDWH